MSIKNIVCIASCLFISGSAQKAFADYDKCELEITLTSVNNSESRIFLEFSGVFDPDSMNSYPYLIQILKEGNVLNEKNVLSGATYRYDCGGIYTYFSYIPISLDTIKSIKVNDIFHGTYMDAILSDIELADTIWFTKEPVKKMELKNNAYDYDVYIYEKNKQLNKLIKLLELEYKKPIEVDNNKRINDLIKEMNVYKVVVTSFGSGC